MNVPINNTINKDVLDDSGIVSAEISEKFTTAYLDYSMTVIVNRALPNFFDGLKPAQRKIIFSMAKSGYYHFSPYKKCISVVGDVLGKYHPHGQTAVYETLVRMGQPFSLRIPLIDGQGNFGSIDGDPAAADRYTECRLANIAKYLVDDYDKDTVSMIDNFDQTRKMPECLPAGFPNLLVNGAYGIAVGMSTSIPPHNLSEIIDATCAMINNPEISLSEILTQYIKGPDLPTGGSISIEDALNMYNEGRGSFICRGIAKTEGLSIIITEIPYQVTKSKLVEEIITLAKTEQVPEIASVRDESSLEGIRVVVDLKRGSDPDLILRKLYAKTPLEISISVNMLALKDNQPRQFNLLSLLKEFILEREQIIIRRTKFYLKNAKFRAHVLCGQALALSRLDDVISTIRRSTDLESSITNLMTMELVVGDMQKYVEYYLDNYKQGDRVFLSEIQAKAINNIRLQSLTRLESGKIIEELEELGKKMQELKKILDNRDERYKIMQVEMDKIKGKFATDRKTIVTHVAKTGNDLLSFVKAEDCVITLSVEGFIKATPLAIYKLQNRGGKGRSGSQLDVENDPIQHMIVANTHDDALFFTDKGRVYHCQIGSISQQKKSAGIANIINLSKEEKVATILTISKADSEIALTGQLNKHILFVTSTGYVRVNSIHDFVKIKSNGKKSIPLDSESNETLVSVILVERGDQILITGSNGKGVRFNVMEQVRVFSGRESRGVIGMSLNEGDSVVSATLIKQGSSDSNIITITKQGFGKVSKAEDYRLTSRGTKGVIVAAIDSKTGPVMAAHEVTQDAEVLLMASSGQTIRCVTSNLKVVGRNSKGVHMMKLKPGEFIANVVAINEQMTQDYGETDS